MENINKINENNTEPNVIIPFGLTSCPMTKLAIINFEKKPDSVYKGLELQYFDDDKEGRG